MIHAPDPRYRAPAGLYVPSAELAALSVAAQGTLGEQIVTRAVSLDAWAYSAWLPNPDPVLKALGKDIAVYRDLRADAHIGGCIRRRKAALRALDQDFDRGRAPARVAREVEAILADLPMMELAGELADAALYGYQPAEILWARRGALLAPKEVTPKPPEWFCFDAENRLRFRTRDAGMAGELLPDRKFVLARQEPSYANPYGLADLSLCFWPAAFKKGGFKFWVAFGERYGTPFLIGKLPRANPARDYEALADKLEAMVQEAVAVIPDDGSIAILEPAGKADSVELYERLLMYCRSEIAIALLGQNQTTEAEANRASATAGLEVARTIRDGDAALVTAAIRQVIAWIVELNWPGAAAPTWTLREQKEIDQIRPARDKILVEAGVRFTRAYWRETYGLREEDLEPETARDPEAWPSRPAIPASAGTGETPPPQAQFAAQGTGPSRPAIPASAGTGETPPPQADAQEWIDLEATRDPGWQGAMDTLLAPILAALDEGLTPEEILGKLGDWYPLLDDAAMIELLERGVAAAEAIGRLDVQAEASSD